RFEPAAVALRGGMSRRDRAAGGLAPPRAARRGGCGVVLGAPLVPRWARSAAGPDFGDPGRRGAAPVLSCGRAGLGGGMLAVGEPGVCGSFGRLTLRPARGGTIRTRFLGRGRPRTGRRGRAAARRWRAGAVTSALSDGGAADRSGGSLCGAQRLLPRPQRARGATARGARSWASLHP